MRKMLSALCLISLCGSASAIPGREDYTAPGRNFSPRMTCGAARAIVSSRGAALIDFGSGPRDFDRYVRDESFCYRTQGSLPGFVPTRDNAQCFVGYYCTNKNQLPYDY
jgi:hypothetical protein